MKRRIILLVLLPILAVAAGCGSNQELVPGRYGTVHEGQTWVIDLEDDGSWTDAINMGPEINSTGMDYCPSLSPDGKYLFFSSYRPIMIRDKGERYDSDELLNMYRGPGNGLGDIYWVDAKVIEELREEILGL